MRTVRRFGPETRADFFRLHAEAGGGWCYCTAWHVPTWDGWGERTAAENRRLRETLLDQGAYDGYLLFEDDRPIGWCQIGPRSRLPKLEQTYGLAPAPEVWAVTCFLIAPDRRRRGAALFLLQEALQELAGRGVRRVQGFPRTGRDLAGGDAWTGPESVFEAAGFHLCCDDPRLPVWEVELIR